jgi:hypothetical protein
LRSALQRPRALEKIADLLGEEDDIGGVALRHLEASTTKGGSMRSMACQTPRSKNTSRPGPSMPSGASATCTSARSETTSRYFSEWRWRCFGLRHGPVQPDHTEAGIRPLDKPAIDDEASRLARQRRRQRGDVEEGATPLTGRACSGVCCMRTSAWLAMQAMTDTRLLSSRARRLRLPLPAARSSLPRRPGFRAR